MSEMGIKVVSFNVNGLNGCIKRKRISSVIADMDAYIVLLQETHLKSAALPAIKSSKFQKQFVAPGTSKARAVAVLATNSLRFDCSQILSDPLGRDIFVKGLLEGQHYTIGSVYAPNYSQ